MLTKHNKEHRSNRFICIHHCLIQGSIHPVKYHLYITKAQTITVHDAQTKLTDCLPEGHDFTCSNSVTSQTSPKTTLVRNITPLVE
jgi:hypothetical protein